MLIDQYGQPLQKAQLLEEQATPSLTGVRSILSDHVTYGIDPYKLARLMRQADQGNMADYLAMAEEIEEKDPHYLSVISTRKRAVSQLEIIVDAASEDKADQENADLIRAWLDRDTLQAEIFNILDAIGKGFSATEIIWDTKADLWSPQELTWRDPRWFVFDKNDGTTLMLRDNVEPQALNPYKFIVHKHQAKSGLPVKGGVVRSCAWMWLFKNFSVKDWVVFGETYGQPIRIGKYGAGASKEDRDILMRAVANIGSDAAAIIPQSMMIEFIESAGKTGSVDLFERMAKFMDQQMSKAVLGQTTTTDAISGGHAVSKEHNDVRGDIEASDAKQLAATLNKQLVIPMITLNKGIQKGYPRLRIGRPDVEDTKTLADTANIAVRFGMKISESQLRSRLRLPEPADKDDVLKPIDENQNAQNTQNAHAQGKITASRQASQHNHQGDQIDDLAEEMASEYEEITKPILNRLEKAIEQAKDFEDLKQKLLDLATDIGTDTDKILEQLEHASFNARLAGNLDIGLEHE